MTLTSDSGRYSYGGAICTISGGQNAPYRPQVTIVKISDYDSYR
jgi:hypothetical protein